ENWDEGVEDFLTAVLQDQAGLRQAPQRRWWQRLLDDTRLGRRYVLAHTRRQTAVQREHYPAIEAALRAVAAGASDSAAGYRTEQEEFAALVSTPTHRNLLDLFFAREAARNPATWTDPQERATHPVPIRSIG